MSEYLPGLAGVPATQSNISSIDGEKGILRYRGIPVEQLAEHSSFVETSFLLINGYLPRKEELRHFSDLMNFHSLIHERMRHFFDNFPNADSHLNI